METGPVAPTPRPTRARRLFDGAAAFFRSIGRSCYDMEYYRGVRLARLRSAFGYLAALLALTTALGAAAFVPASIAVRDAVVMRAKTLPDSARFALDKGRLTTNLPQPFQLGGDHGAMTIDTGHDGQVPPDGMADGTILIGRDAVFVSDGGETRIAPLAGLPDVTLTKQDIVSRVDAFRGAPFAAASVALIVAWYIAVLIGTGVYALVMALGAWSVARVTGTRLRYAQWLATCLHAATLPMLASAALGAWLRMPYVYTALFLMILIAVAVDERARPVPAAPLTTGPAA